MNLVLLPSVTTYLADWSSAWEDSPELYTNDAKLRVLTEVADDLDLSVAQRYLLVHRATPRIAFAPPALYALRVLHSLSEVIR